MVNGNRGGAEVFNTFHRVFNKLYKAYSARKLSFGFHNAITKKRQIGSNAEKKPPKKIYKEALDGPKARGYNRKA